MVSEKQENEGIERKWRGPRSLGNIFFYKTNSEASILSPSFDLKSTTSFMLFQEYLENQYSFCPIPESQ